MHSSRSALRVTLAGALALALAGCSGNSAPDADSSSDAAPNAPAVTATPSATTAAAAAKAIPAALRGRWGLVAADCTSTHGDAKGLLEVGATTLKFYESLARLAAVKETADDRILATYAFSGEGQEWTLDVDLRSHDGGTRLIRRDSGPDAMPGPLTYTRCS